MSLCFIKAQPATTKTATTPASVVELLSCVHLIFNKLFLFPLKLWKRQLQGNVKKKLSLSTLSLAYFRYSSLFPSFPFISLSRSYILSKDENRNIFSSEVLRMHDSWPPKEPTTQYQAIKCSDIWNFISENWLFIAAWCLNSR